VHELSRLVDRQETTIVGERVDDDDGVRAGLDDLVEIAQRARAGRARERSRETRRRVP
jgi:hypothetical protein